MVQLSKLEQKILIYLDSEEPFSSAQAISNDLKIDYDKVLLALRNLQKKKLVIKKDGRWVPSGRYIP